MFFYWSLVLVVITLPLPKYNLNSQSIILLIISWLLYNSIQEKYENLKKNFITFLIISSIFWMSLIGLIYTQDFNEGIKNIQKNLPFVIFPLVLFSVPFKHTNRQLLLKYFSYSVIIASLFALTKAFYFKINNLGDFFYFDQLKRLLEKHTTYFALFIVIAAAYFTDELLKKNSRQKWHNLIPITCLLLMLYLLSVRISIIAVICAVLILSICYNSKISNNKFGFVVLIIMIPLLFYLAPNFQKRFNTKTPEGVEISDIKTRIVHWEAVLSSIYKNNIVFGAGTGDGHLTLYDQYSKHNFKAGYIYKYNAHNQFLESVLYFGLTGLLLLLLILIIVLKNSFQSKHFLGVSLVIVFLVFMFTESILQRHSGIVLFSFITSLLSIPNRE